MTTTSERPAESAGELYRRTDISPEDFFQTLGRVRRAARDEIERLIEWLDSTIDCDQDAAVDDEPCDGDPDLESSLGSFDRMSNQIKAWDGRAWGDPDCELDRCDDEASDAGEDGGDDEPSLASCCGRTDQTFWNTGQDDDREGGPGCDDNEPALGWNDEEAALGRYPSIMGMEG